MEGKIFGKVMNIESPGDDIYLDVNGQNALLQDGAEVWLRPEFVEAIKNTEYTGWVKKDNAMAPVQRKRFAFLPMAQPVETDELIAAKQTEAVNLREKKTEIMRDKPESQGNAKKGRTDDEINEASMRVDEDDDDIADDSKAESEPFVE